MRPGYSARYRREVLSGESGWSYQCLFEGRVIFEGWARGLKHEAEAEVSNGISNREALFSLVREAS